MSASWLRKVPFASGELPLALSSSKRSIDSELRRASTGSARTVARSVSVTLLLLAGAALGAETTVLPRGVFLLDAAYVDTHLDRQWSGTGTAVPLVDDNPRYEPGGGLQGILRARPEVRFRVLFLQLLYGITDRLLVGVVAPLIIDTTIQTHLSWQPGDYSSALGRAYSEEDFWQWAQSMGQPRVPDRWTGNSMTWSDISLVARSLLPEPQWLEARHFRWSGTLQAALPTGTNFDPEAVVSAGTNLWELHAAGDLEAHVAMDQSFFVDGDGLARLNLGADLFASWFRPRTYRAGKGTVNPLLNDFAPYVGDTYSVWPGAWVGGTVSADVTPIIGPSRASLVSGYSAEKAARLPALLSLNVGLTGIATAQSTWQSQSVVFDWDHEKAWQPGQKFIAKATLTLSLMRLGVPLQVYAGARLGSLLPGRYTRPSDAYTAGVRAFFSFW